MKSDFFAFNQRDKSQKAFDRPTTNSISMAGNEALNMGGTGFVGSIVASPTSEEDDPTIQKGSPGHSISSTTPSSTPSFQEEGGETATSPQSKARTFLIMFAIYLAVLIAVLDTVSLPTALPTITVALSASDSGFAWIGATHMISGAASVAFWAKISDIFGRKSVLIAAKALFIAGSLVSALCVGIRSLFVGRVIQGMSGAGIILLANLVIDDLFNNHDRGFYLGLVGLTWSIAMAIAPVVGGLFANTNRWRWCFWSRLLSGDVRTDPDADSILVNLPCIGLSLLVLFSLLRSHHSRMSLLDGLSRIDWLGTMTIIASTILFLVGIEFGGVQFPWPSAPIICLIIFGIVTFMVFLLVEWRLAKQPLLPLRFFKNRSTAAAFAVCVTHGMAFQSHLYFMPCYFQAVLGASPGRSGLWSLIMTGVMAVTNVGVGLYIKKRGGHSTIIRIGTVLLTLGLGLFIDLQPHREWTRIILYQLIVGVGLGMVFQPPLVALQTHLRGADVAAGTSAFLFLRPLSYGVSAVVGQLLLQSQMKTKYSQMLRADISPRVAATLAFEDTVKGTPLIKYLTGAQQAVVRSAVTNGLEKIWIFYTVIAFVGLVASFCIVGSTNRENGEQGAVDAPAAHKGSEKGLSDG